MELYKNIYAVYLADILYNSLDDDNDEIYKSDIDNISLSSFAPFCFIQIPLCHYL